MTIERVDDAQESLIGDLTTEAPAEPIRTNGSVKTPTVLQMEIIECGAACLAMVLAHYGRWVALEELRTVCGVSRDGSSLFDIFQAATQYGLTVDPHIEGYSDLQHTDVPAILWWNSDHFVVLEHAKGGKYRINDPAKGRRTVDQSEFEAAYSGMAIALRPGVSFQKGGHPPHLLRGALARLRHSRDAVAFVLVVGIMGIIPGLVAAIVSQIFVDQVLSSGTQSLIPVLCVVLVAIAALLVALTQLRYRATVRIEKKLTLVGTANFMGKLLRLPLEFFSQRRTGDLVGRVTSAGRMSHELGMELAGLLVMLSTFVLYGGLMFVYSWLITSLIFGMALLNVIAIRIVFRLRKGMIQPVMTAQGRLQGETFASVVNIENIKASGSTEEAYRRWADALVGSQNARQKAVAPSDALGQVPIFLGALTSVAILIGGGLEIMRGNLSIGQLVAVQTLAAGIIGPLSELSRTVGRMQLFGPSIQRVNDVMLNKVDPRFETPPDPAAPTSLSGQLEMTDVTFGYKAGHPPLVSGFSLQVSPGSRVALVGASGSGKSTIINIAAGLYDPWSGAVRYDGWRMTDFPAGVFSSEVAKVDQNIVLFEGTVRENVTFFDDSVPDEQVIAALRDAQILDEILERPDGLSTHVAEGGKNFSGGQRQRIEIARALALNPRLLVLDEATSALDTITEQRIDDALRARGVTCLIAAHRLSTVRDANEIVVLGPGATVLERGTHAELLRFGGEYARLVAEAGEGGDVGE